MKPVLVIAFLTLISCSPNPYRVMSADSKDMRTVKRMEEKFIFLDKAHFENDLELTRLVDVLNKKTAQTNLTHFNLTAHERLFVEAVQHMRTREYEIAIGLLRRLDADAFDCQVALLLIDCQKELRGWSPGVARYQAIYDCSRHPQVKALVKQRFRLSKYGF